MTSREASAGAGKIHRSYAIHGYWDQHAGWRMVEIDESTPEQREAERAAAEQRVKIKRQIRVELARRGINAEVR
jgi:hypothetical protein